MIKQVDLHTIIFHNMNVTCVLVKIYVCFIQQCDGAFTPILINRLANIFCRYQYIGNCKLYIGIGHICIGIGYMDIGIISIGTNFGILAKITTNISYNISYQPKIGLFICIGISNGYVDINISIAVKISA